MYLNDFFPTYEINPKTNEMIVEIPRAAWNPLIQQSAAFKNRR